jgi:hypothetical protein
MRRGTGKAGYFRAAVAATLGLTACTTSVVVETDFPTPLVESLPVSVGLIFDPELRNFVHAEIIRDQAAWTIDLGDTNVAMLEPLFSTMFAETIDVGNISAEQIASSQLDGVLRSTLEKFEFDVPFGQRDQFVEVWMQYRFFLYERDGEVVAEWPVTGYGKAELERKREEAVRRAAIVAMREAGATISTQFASQPQVAYWLEERQDAAAALSVETRLNN